MPRISSSELHSVAIEVFRACGAPDEEAELVSEHLVESNLQGVDSHGVIRIPQYFNDIKEGVIRPGAPVEIVKNRSGCSVVNCGWNFGLVGAARAMRVAIENARKHSLGMVVTIKCNHAGRLGYYMEMATKAGFLALGYCSSPIHGHFVVPWGGREGRLSTNPIAYGAPRAGGPPIISDFSTSQTPEGKIRLYRNRKQRLPQGWILDSSGEESTSPADFYGPPQGAILPFGGNQGYRGYALGLLVEIMGTILAGNDTTQTRPGNGVSFIVIDPEAFIGRAEYERLMERMAEYIKSSRPVQDAGPVMLPGEPERRVRETRAREGVEIEEATWEDIQQILALVRGAKVNMSANIRQS